MENKVVIITGGSSGIGRSLAFEFGSKGSKILITGRNEEALKETTFALKKENIEGRYFVADVSSKVDNQKMVDYALQQYGQIDVLINNAGMSMRAMFHELELEVIDKIMDINFRGAVYATKACISHIMKTKGSIIGISSIAGFRGLPGRTGYSASKAALQGFLEVIRTEMLGYGVHVMTACPGFTASNIRNTALTKDGSAQNETPRDENKMMSSEECAAIIYKATMKRKKFCIMTIEGKLAVWMNKLFPSMMDKIIYKKFAKEPGANFPPIIQ